MAQAVAEAQRVLRPGGLLLDIHPRGEPLRLEVWWAHGPSLPAGRAPEDFERRLVGNLAPEDMASDFTAATQAMAGAPGFAPAITVHFDYRFFFDSLDDLTAYLEENEELDLAGDALLEEAVRLVGQALGPAQLVLVQPVIVTSLRKP